MKFKIQKIDLLESLSIASKGVSTRTTIPILQSFLIKAHSDRVTIFSSDTQISIETNVKTNILKDGQVALDARLFFEIVRKLPNDIVTIETNEDFYTTISASNSVFKLQGLAGNDFINFPEIEKKNWFTFSSGKLRDMINKTKFAVAIKEYQPILKGILLEVKDNNLNFVSMDGFRVAFRQNEIDNETNDISTVVPAKTLVELSKIFTDDESDVIINISDKYVLFDLGSTKVISRVLEGRYPPYEKFFSEEHNTMITVGKETLYDAIDRASLIARESKKNPVMFDINDDVLTISSNTELGETTEEIQIKKSGDDIRIAFNPRYFLEAVSVIDDEEITILLTSSRTPCTIKSLEKKDYRYLIVPIRTNV